MLFSLSLSLARTLAVPVFPFALPADCKRLKLCAADKISTISKCTSLFLSLFHHLQCVCLCVCLCYASTTITTAAKKTLNKRRRRMLDLPFLLLPFRRCPSQRRSRSRGGSPRRSFLPLCTVGLIMYNKKYV